MNTSISREKKLQDTDQDTERYRKIKIQKKLTSKSTDGKNLTDGLMWMTNTWMCYMDDMEGQMDEINQQTDGLMNGV